MAYGYCHPEESFLRRTARDLGVGQTLLLSITPHPARFLFSIGMTMGGPPIYSVNSHNRRYAAGREWKPEQFTARKPKFDALGGASDQVAR